MELSTLLPQNAANTGQFERTLIVAEEGARQLLEGCTAPMRDENQSPRRRGRTHRAGQAEIKVLDVQNCIRAMKTEGCIYNS